jgi:hypothetical protein
MARAKRRTELETKLSLHLTFTTDPKADFVACTQQIMADDEPTIPFTDVFPADNVLALRKHVSAALYEYVMLQEGRARKREEAASAPPS